MRRAFSTLNAVIMKVCVLCGPRMEETLDEKWPQTQGPRHPDSITPPLQVTAATVTKEKVIVFGVHRPQTMLAPIKQMGGPFL